MAETVAVDREIGAPAGDVWALVADVTRMGEFSPETTGCTWRRGSEGPAVGARFRGKNDNGRRSWATSCEVTECEPGRAFAFDVSSGPFAVASWSYRFEPTATGCRVTEETVDHRKGLFRWVAIKATATPDRAGRNRDTMTETLDRLAAVAESEAAG